MKIFHLGLYLKYMLRMNRATQCKQCKLEIYNKSLTILGWIWKYITCWIGSRDNFWTLKGFGLWDSCWPTLAFSSCYFLSTVFRFPICYLLFVYLLFSICVFVIFNLLFLDCETAADQLWLVPITLPLSLSSFPQQKRTWSIKEETRYIVQKRVHDHTKGKSKFFFQTCFLITIPSSEHSLKSTVTQSQTKNVGNGKFNAKKNCHSWGSLYAFPLSNISLAYI